MTRNIMYQHHKIHVNVEGAGKPILLLHGWPANANLWKAQRNFLKDRYLVIAPDWLGFGQSDKPAGHDYTFPHMKEILHEIIRQLLPPDEQVTIVAHDIGGPATLLWAHENQERVRKLIMLNTLFYNFQTPLDRLGHFVFDLPLINRLQLSDFGLSGLVLNLLKSKKEESLNLACEMLKGHEAWQYTLRRKTIVEPRNGEGRKVVSKLAGIFKTLSVEKHLVITRKDPLCYAHMQRIHEENPEVPAHFLEDCGHFIPFEQPDVLNKQLDNILIKGVPSVSIS